MNEQTIIEVTYLISKDSYTLKGKTEIEEDLKDNLETLYMYEDIQTEEELNDLIEAIPNNFDYVMNYVCDLMELDYKYLEV
uniref:Uncharacterized protein n=1 Tax=Staphylococcus phage 184DA TaxID=3110532 RepID=A0AAU6MX43_9CAUD